MSCRIRNLFLINRSKFIVFFVFSIPFFGWYNPYVPFLFFLIISLTNLWYINRIPFLFKIKIILTFIFLFYYQNDLSTIGNLVSIVLADFFSLVMAFLYLRYDDEIFLNKISNFCFYGIFFGFVFSVFLSYFSEVSNPIYSLLNKERVLILAPNIWGHSILNEWGVLALISVLALQVTYNYNNFFIFKIGILVLLLFFAGNSTAILCLLVLFFTFLIEKMKIRNHLKNIVHIFILTSAVILICNQDLFTLLIQWLRFDILGQDPSMYRNDDLTSGRADLTRLLINVANENPFWGAGQNHPVLKYGVTLETGEDQGATSESPLRLAAKYGWVYFTFTLLFWLMPFFAGFKYQKLRAFFIFSGYSILILGGTNAGFSVAQSNFYIFYSPIVVMAILILTNKNKRKTS